MKIITKGASQYPQKLEKLKKQPERLYVMGNEELLQKNSIAIVGSRHCSEYGKRTARKFARELASIGIVIISGLAIGIDTEAHKGCIDAGGKTIAVLPSGFYQVYPKQNIPLYEKIIEKKGAVISEYMPETEASYQKFIERNRLVSGISLGTIVIEAGYRSGTSITARLTKEQGKPVFCVPSNIESSYGIGTNKMIQQGAKLLTNLKEIIETIEEIKINIGKPVAIKNEVNKEYEKLYKQIKDTPTDINEIYRNNPNHISDISYQLTMLEIEGNIRQLPNGFYIRNN